MTRMLSLGMIGCTLVLVLVFGSRFGSDYSCFYFAGKILNSTPERLYDLRLQEQWYDSLVPDAVPGTFCTYPYAPFLALLYQPLAVLPYAWSYFLWLVIGLVLYATSFWLLSGRVQDRFTLLLAAISFTPFLIEGWLGGQTTGLVVFIVATAMRLQPRYPLLAGTVLAALAFKPTLLGLIVPMLLVTGCFRVLVGLALGGVGAIAASWWAVGWSGCLGWLHSLHTYTVAKATPGVLRSFKYVDLQSTLPTWAAVLVGVVLLVLLFRFWRRADQRKAWALALIFTPVLNVHCAIYDVSLVVPALLLLGINAVQPWATLIYIMAWFTQPVALATGFQPITFLLILFGVHQCVTSSCSSPWRSAWAWPTSFAASIRRQLSGR